MAQLIVRDLPAELVLALKRRAASRNRSAEQEHREILKAALKGTKRRPLAAVLTAIPNVGEDGDFRREQSDQSVAYVPRGYGCDQRDSQERESQLWRAGILRERGS